MTLPASADLPNYPFPANARQFDFEFIRMVHEAMIGAGTSKEGIADASTDLAVTTAGSGLSLNIAAGKAFVKGDDRSTQGSYFVYNDATKVRAATAANATNPRIDRVVLRVYDADVTGATTKWDVEIIAGTPTVGATLTNLSGAAAVPNGCLLLANLLVPAAFAGPFVTATHLQDRRYRLPIAGRMISEQVWTGGAVAGSGVGDKISCTVIGDGATPVDLEVHSLVQNNTNTTATIIKIWDGAGGTGTQYGEGRVLLDTAGFTNYSQGLNVFGTAPAFSGSKTFRLSLSSTGAGTPALDGTAGAPSRIRASWGNN